MSLPSPCYYLAYPHPLWGGLGNVRVDASELSNDVTILTHPPFSVHCCIRLCWCEWCFFCLLSYFSSVESSKEPLRNYLHEYMTKLHHCVNPSIFLCRLWVTPLMTMWVVEFYIKLVLSPIIRPAKFSYFRTWMPVSLYCTLCYTDLYGLLNCCFGDHHRVI